jgi:hypothetical protein
VAKRHPKANKQEAIMAAALDERAAFEDFKESLLPFLRDALKKGWTAEQIQNHPKLQSALMARQMSIALNDKDTSKALAAIKDIRDRTEGKARERLEVTSKLDRTPDEQLDALIKSKLASAAASADASAEQSEDEDYIQ